MMLDIAKVTLGEDLQMAASEVPKAANVCSVQLGSLEYALNFGVDQKYFLDSELQFPNDSYKAYLLQRLTESQISVTQVVEVVETLMRKLSIYVGDNNSDAGGLIL